MFLRRIEFLCENAFRQEKVLDLLYSYDTLVRPETERHFKRWNLQPVTYIYQFNKIEKLLKADRATELKLSAKKYLKLSDAEYNKYYKG